MYTRIYNNTQMTLAKLALYPSGFVDRTSTDPSMFFLKQSSNYFTTAVALAHTQWPPSLAQRRPASPSLARPPRQQHRTAPHRTTLHIHTALVFFVCQAKLLTYCRLVILFISRFKRKEKCVKLCGNPEMSLFFAL